MIARKNFLRIGLALILVAVGWVLTARRPKAPAPPPELPEAKASELVLEAGRLRLPTQSTPFHGWINTYYPGGTPQSRSLVSNGVMHGLSRGWHTNGQVQVEEHFESGVSHGIRVKYFDSGTTQSIGNIVRGKMEGRFTRFYENGTVAEEISLTNGQPHGVSVSYHPNGKVKARVRLEAGMPVESEFFDEQGVPIRRK